MRRMRVNIPGREYDIVVGSDILNNSGKLLREVYGGDLAVIVTDSNVAPLYGDAVCRSFVDAGITPVLLTVPAGETSKSHEQLLYLYEKMLESGLTRGHIAAALGGGVVGDLTGYAAATLLRGIPFVQIPTTLLAQVDSSVGGKVAVNHPRGKNLIGAFYQPKMVIADVKCLDTLPPRVFADGMGEVVKHGAIADAELFSLLEQGGFELESVVYRNCGIKRGVVELDETDTGGRMVLNFGHTFGHAIEAAGNYSIYTHGEAVAMGMVIAARLGERLGVTQYGTAQRLETVLQKHNLPVESNVKFDLKTLMLDKKRDRDVIRLILLKEIGKAEIHTFPVLELEHLL